ncbi:MAG TPA: hypothetical protein VG722_07025, partial [Tepidisphaeraceae bacterium]|nr:hypothetical protein [Tepidisphaeraceae bacterium]
AVGAAAAWLGKVTPARAAEKPSDLPSSDSPWQPATTAYGFDREPYILDPGPHLFIDWRYVMPGRVKWLYHGKSVGLFGEDSNRPPSLDAVDPIAAQLPNGIRIEAQRPDFTGPVLPSDRPWEYLIGYNALHFLDGKYRLWYEVVPPGQQGDSNLLCYAESTDGIHWTKPDLGVVEFKGNKKNNIVFGGPACPSGYGASGVFLDPSAPQDQRVKVVFLTYGTDEQIAQFKKEHPESVTSIGLRKKLFIKVAASPDGIRNWRILDGTLLCHMSDTQSIIHYDPVLNRYIGYFRMNLMNRRMIGMSESTGFNAWPAPQLILAPGPLNHPSEDLYTNSASLYPGTRTMHLMFPTVYQRQFDNTAMRMAASMDGRNWNWISDANLVEPGPPGSWNAGCLFVGHGLTELPDGRVALPCVASIYPHKFPRLVNLGQIGLISWKSRRLSAVVADGDGEFYLQPMQLPGDQLHLNFQTERAGIIKVEVVDSDGQSLNDCQTLRGDESDAIVKWRNGSKIKKNASRGTTLRFQIRAAKIFSFELT